jgi:hypothetical protein
MKSNCSKVVAVHQWVLADAREEVVRRTRCLIAASPQTLAARAHCFSRSNPVALDISASNGIDLRDIITTWAHI